MIFEVDCRYELHRHEVTGRHVVAFSGSREKHWQESGYDPTALVGRCVHRLYDKWGDARLVIKVGDATGIDRMVARACEELCLCYEVLYANWKYEGAYAGHNRNIRVVEGADELIAISRPGRYPSTGTNDAIQLAERAGITVHEWRSKWLR